MTDDPTIPERFRRVKRDLKIFVEGWLPHSPPAGRRAIKAQYERALADLQAISEGWPLGLKVEEWNYDRLTEFESDDSERRAILAAMKE